MMPSVEDGWRVGRDLVLPALASEKDRDKGSGTAAVRLSVDADFDIDVCVMHQLAPL